MIQQFGFICPSCGKRYGEPKSRFGADVVQCQPCERKALERKRHVGGWYHESGQIDLMRRKTIREVGR